MTRLYMHSAIAKDRLPTAATANLEVERYTVVGKNLHRWSPQYAQLTHAMGHL